MFYRTEYFLGRKKYWGSRKDCRHPTDQMYFSTVYNIAKVLAQDSLPLFFFSSESASGLLILSIDYLPIFDRICQDI
jgi:hypothetical protein